MSSPSATRPPAAAAADTPSYDGPFGEPQRRQRDVHLIAPPAAPTPGAGAAGRVAPAVLDPQTHIAPYFNRSAAVLALGLSLVAANYLSNAGPNLWAALTGSQPSSSSAQSAVSLKDLAIQVAIVLGLYFLSIVSDNFGALAIWLFIALWVLFVYTHAKGITAWLTPAAPHSTGNGGGSQP